MGLGAKNICDAEGMGEKKKKQKRRVSQKQIDECLVKEQVANIFQLYLLTGQVRLLNSEKCLVNFGIKVLMTLAETNFV